MLADMPESFPPNRILADLEALRKDSTRMLDLIERETADHA